MQHFQQQQQQQQQHPLLQKYHETTRNGAFNVNEQYQQLLKMQAGGFSNQQLKLLTQFYAQQQQQQTAMGRNGPSIDSLTANRPTSPSSSSSAMLNDFFKMAAASMNANVGAGGLASFLNESKASSATSSD
jgi:hypothetical protein